MIHNASLDKRIMAGAAPFEAELKEQGKTFEAFVYEGTNHGFHNDTTPRYDEAAAKKAWERKTNLRSISSPLSLLATAGRAF